MTFVQLEYFVTACQQGSLVRTAELLHVSQPAVSLALKELERECGFALFYREKKALRLTREGSTLLEHARLLVQQYHQLNREVRDIANSQSLLRIGIGPMSSGVVFPPLYSGFTKKYPDVRVELTEDRTTALAAALERNELDVILVALNADIQARFETVPLYKQDICFCVSESHPLAGASEITLAQMASTPLVLYPPSYYLSTRVEEMFQQGGMTPDIRFRSHQLGTIRSFISCGIASGFLAAPVAEQTPGIKRFSLENWLHSNDIGAAWPRNRAPYGPAERFIRYVQKLERRE